MRVIQIGINALNGDGVSNCMIYLDTVMRKCGYQCEIYAQNVDEYMLKLGVQAFEELSDISINTDDIVIYSFSVGHPLNYEVERLFCKKILLFQNVTPPHFFRGVNNGTTLACMSGLLDARFTVSNYLKALVPSNYSKNLLWKMGWKKKDITVAPLVLFESKSVPNTELLDQYNDDLKNIVFVGRVVPNKKHEDVIRIFDFYQKHYDKNVRLFLVGNHNEKKYYDALIRYCEEKLHCTNVIFTGHVSNEELASYYKLADLFLCMSEHEGLCLPVLEAMRYDVPVLAYKSTAIPETMGDGGVLVDTKDSETVARLMDKILHDSLYREHIVIKEREHIASYNLLQYEKTILKLLKKVESIDEFHYGFQDEVLEYRDCYETYLLGSQLIFTSNNDNLKYVLSGIDSCEKIGAWTTKKHVELGFRIYDVSEDIYFHIFCKTMTNYKQRIILRANGELIGEQTACNQSIVGFKIPQELLSENQLRIRMEMPDAVRPCEVDSNNPDNRELGICISQLVISSKRNEHFEIEADNSYALGTRIDFSNDECNKYIISGFGGYDGWVNWIIEETALLSFTIASSLVEQDHIVLSMDVIPNGKMQRVEVKVNGLDFGMLTVDSEKELSITIPTKILTDRIMQVAFKCLDLSPSENAEDNRMLAIGIESLYMG